MRSPKGRRATFPDGLFCLCARTLGPLQALQMPGAEYEKPTQQQGTGNPVSELHPSNWKIRTAGETSHSPEYTGAVTKPPSNTNPTTRRAAQGARSRMKRPLNSRVKSSKAARRTQVMELGPRPTKHPQDARLTPCSGAHRHFRLLNI